MPGTRPAPVTFEEWKAQQDDSVWLESKPFIVLGEKERQAYQTACKDGHVMRFEQPYNTQFEKTWTSGSGYGIFVIGPEGNLYCGSHVKDLFHHSSFLGDAATVAAGEIKTNPDGTIVELSNKSGHYRPSDAQNLFLLRYFRDHGVDLSKVIFTNLSAEGKSESRNALEYLTELEKKQLKT